MGEPSEGPAHDRLRAAHERHNAAMEAAVSGKGDPEEMREALEELERAEDPSVLAVDDSPDEAALPTERPE